jgi:hypothetical protein
VAGSLSSTTDTESFNEIVKASNVGAANPAQERARRRFSIEVLKIDAEISFDEFDRVYTENPELIYTKVY